MHTVSSTLAITSIIDQLNVHQLTKACSQSLLANSSRLCEPTGSSRCTLTQSGHCRAPEHACALRGPRGVVQMAMGAHTEKDRAAAVDAIATRFSSMLDDMSALTSW